MLLQLSVVPCRISGKHDLSNVTVLSQLHTSMFATANVQSILEHWPEPHMQQHLPRPFVSNNFEEAILVQELAISLLQVPVAGLSLGIDVSSMHFVK